MKGHKRPQDREQIAFADDICLFESGEKIFWSRHESEKIRDRRLSFKINYIQAANVRKEYVSKLLLKPKLKQKGVPGRIFHILLVWKHTDNQT